MKPDALLQLAYASQIELSIPVRKEFIVAFEAIELICGKLAIRSELGFEKLPKFHRAIPR
jgi:hypothetical protein